MNPFKGPAGFGRIMNIIMNFIISLGITMCIMYLLQKATGAPLFTFANVIAGTVCGTFVGYVYGDIIPFPIWGIMLGMKMHAPRFVTYLIYCIITGLGMATLILPTLAFINNFGTGGWPAVGQFIAQFLPWAWIIAPVLAILFMWLSQAIAKAISGVDMFKVIQGIDAPPAEMGGPQQ